MEFNQELGEYRKEIDKIDLKILELFTKRLKVVSKIGKLKKKNNIQPLDEKKWNEVLGRIVEEGRKIGLSEEFVVGVWERIHEESLGIEKI